MPDLKFKNCGLQIAESKDGDILIYNKELKTDTTVRKKFLHDALEDFQKARIFVRQLLSLFERHTLARWERVIREAEEIKKSGEAGRRLIEKLKPHIIKRNLHSLRKIEKDFYFFKAEGGWNDEVRIGAE